MTGWDCPEASVSPPGQKLMVAPPSPSDHPGVRALGLEADPPPELSAKAGVFPPASLSAPLGPLPDPRIPRP